MSLLVPVSTWALVLSSSSDLPCRLENGLFWGTNINKESKGWVICKQRRNVIKYIYSVHSTYLWHWEFHFILFILMLYERELYICVNVWWWWFYIQNIWLSWCIVTIKQFLRKCSFKLTALHCWQSDTPCMTSAICTEV